MSQHNQLDKKIKSIYEKSLAPLATRLAFNLPLNSDEAPGLPNVLFLGNHSSGKSSFINHLIQADIQKTGVAPTDDGFTIITYGERADTFDGQTVTSHPDLAFKDLEQLGPAFIARLKLKAVPSPLLKSFALIDSPGMIDAVSGADSRHYDFEASVRLFAERADLILLFFDPDKPGTTAETIQTLTNTLAGLEFKLLIILNKADQFDNIRDFARTYGTLCWNLSKVIGTKDLPHIFNTYLPEHANHQSQGSQGGIPLNDFDLSRNEIIEEIQRTPTRRLDNLVSELLQTSKRLVMHARICNELAREYRRTVFRWIAIVVCILAGAGWGVWWSQPFGWKIPASIGAGGVVIAAGGWFLLRHKLARLGTRATTPDCLDEYFTLAYRRELTLQNRFDLHGIWNHIRAGTVRALKVIPLRKIPNSISLNRTTRRLENLIEKEIPKLRRSIAEYQQEKSE